MYEYKAKVIRVVDGDTIDADVHLGFYMTARIRFRLAGIDTMEIHSRDAAERSLASQAKARVQLLVEGKDVLLLTTKTDKYGRWLARVILADGTDLNQLLITENLAVPYMV